MIEYVFRPSRRVNGKRVLSPRFCGRYSLRRGEKPVTVALDTPDEQVARKRLRDIVVEKQREAVGLISPKMQREALLTPLSVLLDDYSLYLNGQDLSTGYLVDTMQRIRRILKDTGWKFLGDIRPDSFLRWRGTLKRSAKTVKEYQVSLNAFLNHLVKVERLERNPLQKIEHVPTRGKQVRPYRAFTEEELQKLFAVAGERLLVYQVMLYTGQRPEEVAALVWDDLHLQLEKPFVLVRETTTKDSDKRAVPLHDKLASVLRLGRAKVADGATIIFPTFPTRRTLLRDLERAGIEAKDGLGRTLHLRSFRKTWQTRGVRFGINQRSAQAILGHSDPSLTANVYTDVPALALHDEIAKLPWIGGAGDNAQPNSQKPSENLSFQQLVFQIIEAVKVHSAEISEWSGRRDSNSRPPGPKPGALPG